MCRTLHRSDQTRRARSVMIHAHSRLSSAMETNPNEEDPSCSSAFSSGSSTPYPPQASFVVGALLTFAVLRCELFAALYNRSYTGSLADWS